MTERYDRNKNVISTAKYFRYALHFNPFKFKKGERAMCPFLKVSSKKGNVSCRKQWDTSEVVMRS